MDRREDDAALSWLSLDPQDSDPARFWSFLVEALRIAAPGIGESTLALVRAGRGGDADVFLPPLLNELAALAGPIVLVLDDYHVVTGEPVHRGMAFLVDHQPSSLRIVIATRTDPPLPVGRLRAQGRLAEVRAEHLRFSAAEAHDLLNGVLGLHLDDGDVELLHERTEGWAAGLCLAALSLQGQPDAHAFVAAFAGDARHVVDYLAVEVLEGQPADRRDFLLRTSILERLSGGLCDAVAGRSDSTLVLEEMERSNLFLVPLDTQRRWYRYHHLFGRLLRTELERTAPGELADLHGRAAAWFRAHDEVPEAISHATAGGRVEEAVDLIARHWTAWFNLGRLAGVTGWLDALPAAAVTGSPALCVARAWVAMDLGRLEDAGAWVAAADAALDPAAPGPASSTAGAETAVLRAVHRFKIGDVGGGARAARAVLALDPPPDLFQRTVAGCVLGATAYWARDAAAEEALREAVALATLDDNRLARCYCLGYLALCAVDRGDLEGAAVLARDALGLSDEPAFEGHFVTMVARLAGARGALDDARLEEARAIAERAIACARAGAGRVELAAALLVLAEVRTVSEDAPAAGDLVQEAAELLDGCPDPGRVAEDLARARLALAAAEGAPGAGELTARELAVLRLMATRVTQGAIAEALHVSQNTVKTHARSIYRKIGASSRAEAVARGRRLGLLGRS